MHDEVQDCLRTILPQALQHARQVPREDVDFMLFTRTSSGWSGMSERRPVLPIGQRLYPEELAARFQQVMSGHHPEHLGLVGTVATGGLRLDAEYLLRSLVHAIWSSHGNLDVGGDAIDSAVADFAAFIDATDIQFTYLAPILNLELDASVAEILLASGVRIRRISDAEATELWGGRMDLPKHRDMGRMPSCAFAGEFAEPKWFESNEPSLSQALAQLEQAQAPLRRAVLALRSFKSGPIGYRHFHMKPVGFCPFPLTTRGSEAEHIPLGRYVLSADEVHSLRTHAQHVAARLHPSLDLAISRLSDAEVRISPRDKLIDAVIGLEAVLLPQGQRQELRYRFAMHYASLVDAPGERLARFGTALGIYDCRSRLAHGGHIEDDELVSVGEHKLTLSQAAEAACEMLSEVVKLFLPEGDSPAFCGRLYWEQRLFGLTRPRQ